MQFTPIIRKGLRLIEEREKVIGRYYPSELSYCIRREHYSYLQKTTYDLEARKAFAIGDAIHQLIDNAFSSYSLKFPYFKVTVEIPDLIYNGNGFVVSGRLDALVEYNNERHIIEIKSHANPLRILNPNEHHLSQLNYYLHFYPDAKGHIIYVNKSKKIYSNVDFLEFPKKDEPDLSYNDSAFKELMSRAERLHQSLVSGVLPEPEAKLNNELWQCKVCPFRKMCEKQILESKTGMKVDDLVVSDVVRNPG